MEGHVKWYSEKKVMVLLKPLRTVIFSFTNLVLKTMDISGFKSLIE